MWDLAPFFTLWGGWPIRYKVFGGRVEWIRSAKVREVGDYDDLFVRAGLAAAPNEDTFAVIKIDVDKLCVVDAESVAAGAQFD